MWITNGDLDRLTEKFRELMDEKLKTVTKYGKIVTCVTCRTVFEPRPWPQHFPPDTTKNYSSDYCDRCAPAEFEKKNVANWAMNNPDKAKLCMEKHKGTK